MDENDFCKLKKNIDLENVKIYYGKVGNVAWDSPACNNNYVCEPAN